MIMDPLSPIPIGPLIAEVPKADLHLHQEAKARLGVLAARRQGRTPYDRQSWAKKVLEETLPGMSRLDDIYEPDDYLDLASVPDADPEIFIERVVDVLEESAADGAVLVEVRFGANELVHRHDFMALFREAERRVQKVYPGLCAEAIGYLNPVNDPSHLLVEEQRLEACLRAASEGLAGIDFRVDPYETEADPAAWAVAYRWAERAYDAGLGITVHAAEFSTANLAAALRVPGLKRLGHAVYAASDDRLLDALALSGSTVECSVTCNVILGAVPSYEAHPIKRFVEHGIPVTLSTDLPVHVCTTIGKEYAIAHRLGFSTDDLLGFTRNAVKASFTTVERRDVLLAGLQQWATRGQSAVV